MIKLVVFTCSVAFVPWWRAGAVAPRWMVMFIGPALVLWLARQITFSVEHALLFALWVFAGATLNWSHPDSVSAFIALTTICLAFTCGQLADESVFTWLAAGVSASSVAVIVQLAGVWPWPEVATPSGLWHNKNVLAEIAVLALIAMIVLRKYWWALACLPAATLTQSKGALIALGTSLAIHYFRVRPKLAISASAMLLCGIGYLIWQQWGTSVVPRFGVQLDTLSQLSIFGRGLGSFYTLAPTFATAYDPAVNRYEHPHNEYLEWAFELGFVGLAVLAVIYLLAVRNAPSVWMAVFVGIMVESLFSFPWHMPGTALIGAIVVGKLCSLRHVSVVEMGASRTAIYESNAERKSNGLAGARG